MFRTQCSAPWPACLALAIPLLLGGGAASGAEGWSGSLAVTTDYIERGVSQSDGDPALQGSIAFWHPTGWYAGAWASNGDTPRRYYASSGTHAELNLFAGYTLRPESDWVLDAHAVRYLYPNDPAPVSYNYNELTLSAAWRGRLYASLSVSPDTTVYSQAGWARNRTATTLELSMQQPLSRWLTLIAGVGRHDVATTPNVGYYYGSASLALQLRRITLEVGEYVTSGEARRLFGSRLAGTRTVGTVSVSF